MSAGTLFVFILLIYIFFICSYWCIDKHLGKIGIYTLSVLLTIEEYLNIMNLYLFSSKYMFFALTAALIIIITIIAVYIDTMLIIDNKIQTLFAVFMCILNILLPVYAELLSEWSVIPQSLFPEACAAAGLNCGFFAGFILEYSVIRFNTGCFYLIEQIIKFTAGISSCIIFSYIIYMSEDINVIHIISSFLCSFWISGVFPVFITKIQRYEYRHR